MSAENFKDNLKGLVIPMPTPFKSDYELDMEGLRGNTRFLVEKGIKTGKGVCSSPAHRGVRIHD